MSGSAGTRSRRGPDDWDWRARLWLALVAAPALPALAAPLALLPLPHGFPLALLGALSLFLRVCAYAVGWAGLSALVAGAATLKGDLPPRVLAVIWGVVLLAAIVAVSTAGRLAAHGA